YLKAESDYTIMNVKVESLSKKLTLMGINPTILSTETIQTTIRITSPISGYVTSVNVNKGSFLSPSQTALSIVNTDHLHLELKVFEKDLIKVETDQPILFKLLDGSTKEHQATVHLVNKSVDPEDRTVGIHGHLSEQKLSSKFNPGMYVEADILTTSESKAALPQEAIVELEGKYFVLVLVTSSTESYTFMKKEVNVGSSINGYVQILNANDFKDNSEVLVKGAFNLITE
ncbi:MAG: efflux RND transporter periplasmic adaptor subunit, partial [Ekhidna sp.]